MLTIYVDADACPVKEEVLKVAGRHALEVYFVSNQWLRMAEGKHVHRVTVPDGPDAADDWIAERIGTNDIAITADIPLASRCIKQGAHAINNNGKPFTTENIGTALAMRDLSAHLRETGEIAGYNPGFTRQDRSRFLQTLEEVIQKVKRGR